MAFSISVLTAVPLLLFLAAHWYLQPVGGLRSLENLFQAEHSWDDGREADVVKYVQEEMDKLRMHLTAGFLGITIHLIAGMVVVDSVTLALGFRNFGLSSLLGAYVLFGCLKYYVEKYKPSHRRQLQATSAVMVLWLFRVMTSNTITVVTNGTARLAGRSCLLNFALDVRFACGWNLVFLIVNCASVAYKNDPVISLGPYIVGELGSFVMSIILSDFVSMTVNTSIKQGLLARGLSMDSQACRRLLSAVCDAQVLLGEDFVILKHCDSLQHLLMTGGARGSLKGTSFLQRLAVPDQLRFKVFIEQSRPTPLDDESSSQTSEEPLWSSKANLTGRPTTLNVHLTDSLGIVMPVELYHINVPELKGEKVNHLIGISESSSKSVGSADGHSVRRESLSPPPELASGARLEVSSSLHGAASVASSSARSSSSSASSQSSLTSAAGFARRTRPFPELKSVEIWLNPMEDDFPIYKAEVNFRGAAESDEAPSGMDRLTEWLHPRSLDGCKTTIQNHVNALFSEEDAPEELQLGPIALCTLGDADQTLDAQTATVTLAAEERDGLHTAANEGGGARNEAPDEDDASDGISIVAKLELSTFSIRRERSGSDSSRALRSSSRREQRRRLQQSAEKAAASVMGRIPELRSHGEAASPVSRR